MMQRSSHLPLGMRCLLWLLLLLACGPLLAATTPPPNCTASSVTLGMPSGISVQPDAPIGPISGATGTATIIFTCSGLPASTKSTDYTAIIQAGQTLATLDSTNVPAGPGITFKTNISGIALLVTASPVQATSESGSVNDGPTSTAGYVPGSVVAPSGTPVGTYSNSVTASYTGQLVKTTTGAVTPGTINTISLIPFWWYIPGGSVDSTSINLNASLNLPAITVSVPTCTISGGNSFTVTLPTASTQDLSATGKVTDMTPFSIVVTGCPDNVSVASNVFTGGNINTDGNLKNTGTAKRVELQLLNGAGSSNAAAQSVINLKTGANSGKYNIVGGNVTLNYFVQYYATGKAAAGTVKSSVTYTITYN
ncbi:fimbrial protein [Rhodanobacter sp. Si-c]|uniref:Fimbrial protein n=1 Tax=Rhodanobacter lycopersici TaxID=3162487 RepID=A0ABV3QFP3_9GAMM